MGARARNRPRHRPQGEGVTYSREFLERLARILVGTGHSPGALSREFREICSRLKEPSARWDPAQLTYLWDLPHVLSFWHSDPQYIDSRGAPIPLPLRGRGASLCALIERVLPGENSDAVVRSLIKFQGVRQRGKFYLPRARHFTYPTSSGRVHGLTALLGMLRTVERNVAGGRKSTPVLERIAMNPRFPVSELPAFHRRLRAAAAEILWNLDGDMRRREAAHPDGPRIRLGVGIFAFEGPAYGSARIKRRSRRRGS
jgi:Family of unknown function (DUF6502)